MFRRCFHESLDVASAGEVFADSSQYNYADAVMFIKGLEYKPQLVALRHFDHVERWAIEDDVGTLLVRIQFHAEAVELCQARVGKCHRGHAAVPSWCEPLPDFSISYSPATSLRRKSLPTGDFGMSLTKM